jgi:hypothetical protein
MYIPNAHTEKFFSVDTVVVNATRSLSEMFVLLEDLVVMVGSMHILCHMLLFSPLKNYSTYVHTYIHAWRTIAMSIGPIVSTRFF